MRGAAARRVTGARSAARSRPTLALPRLSAPADTRRSYAIGDAVRLWVNKVGPYNNPTETYNYYELPFCKPLPDAPPVHKWGGLGEVLGGNELIDSTLEVSFRVDTPSTPVCTQTLSGDDVSAFARAVVRHYWYEFFIDDLPIWGFVGEASDTAGGGGGDDADGRGTGAGAGGGDDADGRGTGAGAGGAASVYVYTHRAFDIAYNGDTIIQVNLTSEAPAALVVGAPLAFTYSVTWHASDTRFAARFERYLDANFFEHQIRWFSIFNSFMMVIFLTGLVSMILVRTLRNDYARYASADDDGEGGDALDRGGEESGWKLVHGDVFRPPRRLALLAALLGTGAQLVLLTLTVTVVTIAGVLFEGRGAIATATIVAYALTSALAGYVSGGFNARHGGRAWIRAMLLTAGLLPGVVTLIAAVLNTIAIFYHSLAAVPFGTIVLVMAIWAFVSGPLVLLGTVLGRNWAGAPNFPCRVKSIPRPIPARAWYASPAAVAALGGLLPFGSIFIEMFFIFTSFWQYKVYYLYGFFLLVFLILLIVTLCVSTVGTYFLLNAENYHWRVPAPRLLAVCGSCDHAAPCAVLTAARSACACLAQAVDVVRVRRLHGRVRLLLRHLLLPIQNQNDGTRRREFLLRFGFVPQACELMLLLAPTQGFFQTCFYFGYTAMFCAALGCMCGAVGYAGASQFVRRIYRNIKCD